MLVRWSDLGRDWAVLDEFRRRVDSLMSDMDAGLEAWPRRMMPRVQAMAGNWPPTNLYDGGDALVLEVEVPGLGEKDIEITATQDVLTLAGERKTEVPEGHSVHRRERGSVKFSRSFTLPGKIDPEKVSARLTDGILTVSLEKAPEAKPKKISVQI